MSFIRNKTFKKSIKGSYSQVLTDLNEETDQQNQLNDNSPSSFMSFTPKTNSDLGRRYTQKKIPTMAEFMTDFEDKEDIPPIPKVIRTPTIKRPESIKTIDSIASYNDSSEIYSETANLMHHGASISGFKYSSNDDRQTLLSPDTDKTRNRPSFQRNRPGIRTYEPASIEPEVDQKNRESQNILRKDYKLYLHDLSKIIQKVSRRVVDLHNFNPNVRSKQPSNIPSEQPKESNMIDHDKLDDGIEYLSDTSSDINETIPMTRTSSQKPLLDDSPTTPIKSSYIPYYRQPVQQVETKSSIQLFGTSLRIFPPSSPFRLFLANILHWKWFETLFMLFLILHGTTLLIIGWGSNPFPSPPSEWSPTWDQVILFVIFVFYSLTSLSRIVVYGLFTNAWPNSKTAFLRHSWNRVDAVAIIAYWIDLVLLLTHQEIIEVQGRRLLVFRMLSSIILLRLLNLTDGNKVILNSLKKAAPLLVNVLLFVLFFFVIFAIIGVQSFKGSFRRHCVWHDPTNSSNTQELQQYCGGYYNEAGVVVPYLLKNGEYAPWSKGFICERGLTCEETDNPYGGTISFDNIFSSMLIVTIIAGVQSWTDRMYDMMDAEYFAASLYFVIVVIVMNFWLINLFIAVITEMFAKVREDSQHSAFTNSKAKPVLADSTGEEGWAFSEQKDKLDQKKTSMLAHIVKYMHPFWILLVVADLLCMAVKNVNMSDEQLSSLRLVETAFTLAFLFEITLRLLSQWQDLKTFFSDKLNLTDFFLAIGTSIIQIPAIHQNEFLYAWLTGFQVLRIYRLVVAVPRLRKLMSRVLGNVRGLINLSFFIILATLLCAIIAFQLFEGVINDPNSDSEMRFYSIYNSFTALYQLFSGEDWTSVLYSVMEAGSNNHNSAIYALFLVFWFAFSNFVLVNMFIAILMENFEIAEEDKRKKQVLQFMEKTENEVGKKTLVHRWNIYRYFKPQANGVNVSNMPSNLTFPAQKNIVREFMNESEHINNASDAAILRPASTIISLPESSPNGALGKIKRNLEKLFTEKEDQSSRTRKTRSLYINPSNAFDQIGTMYDLDIANQSPSLRFVIDNGGIRDNVANRLHGITDYDLEEKRALKRDFIMSHPSYDKSLYIFSNSHRLRRWCQFIVQPSRGERIFGTPASHRGSLIFVTFITICVIINVILTIYNSPVYQLEHRNDAQSLMTFKYVDYVFTIIFSIEFLVKVVADGFILTPNAYLLNGWNMIDFFVLITLCMSNFGSFTASTGLERGFRAFKALRALRLINLFGPAKETFAAILVTGFDQILDAAVLGLCLIVPFALYGQNVFMGLFYLCNDDQQGGKLTCVFEQQLGTQAPMSDSNNIYLPRIWSNPYVYSFDSFWSSLLILFEIASGEGWIDVLTTSMSITGRDSAPQQDASQLWGIFFMVYNLAGSVFVISLFLGVVIENFTKRNGTAYLTSDQRRWLDLKKLLNQIRPAKRPRTVPTNWVRKKAYDWTVEKRGRFYKFMTLVITLNILFLCTDSIAELDSSGVDNGASGWSRIKVYIYLIFIIIYWLEIVIKLLGLGWSSFRKNLWNLFDLTMVIGSLITAIITLGNPNIQVNMNLQKLFMTALCFKLVQRSDSLNQLFTTMAASSYQILNVFAVWFIVLNTYAIMFMQIFSLTKYGPNATSEHINFRSYANTMISLIRYTTGEGWNSVMHDFTVEHPNCVYAEHYLDTDCGSFNWAYFLFLTFNIISMYIFIAIFVAVVADNFSYVYQIQANFSLVNRDEIRKFKMTWASIDAARLGYIKPSQYMNFWRKLDGIFNVRIFEPEYSCKNLVKECSADTTRRPYENYLDLKALEKKLSLLDKKEIHAKRQDLERLYWEAALAESSTRGVSFNQMLLILAQRKLIIPGNALTLEELLDNQKKEEAIHTLISIDRVRGLIETIALRKEFLWYLKNKKQKGAALSGKSQRDIRRHQSTTDDVSSVNHPVVDEKEEAEQNKALNNEAEETDTAEIDVDPLQESNLEGTDSYRVWLEMLKNEAK